MCVDDSNSMPLPSEIQLIQSMITFLKEQVLIFNFRLKFPKTFFFSLVRTTSSKIT